MSRKALASAARRIERRAGGPLDVAVVLGSGLGEAIAARIDGRAIAYGKLGIPIAAVDGHAGLAVIGMWAGKRVAAFAGRAHLYTGHDADDVTYSVRLAAAAGARTIVLTNAAGALNTGYARGDIMLIADQINLTGTTPVSGYGADPFVSMIDAYAPHLRVLARERGHELALREGVYAGVRGPQYETPAECEMLRRLGADAVGMSTVLETIAARSLGLDVLGISLVSNVAGPASEVSHADVLAASRDAAEGIGRLIEGVVAAL